MNGQVKATTRGAQSLTDMKSGQCRLGARGAASAEGSSQNCGGTGNPAAAVHDLNQNNRLEAIFRSLTGAISV
jgi:hypothetical protein